MERDQTRRPSETTTVQGNPKRPSRGGKETGRSWRKRDVLRGTVKKKLILTWTVLNMPQRGLVSRKNHDIECILPRRKRGKNGLIRGRREKWQGPYRLDQLKGNKASGGLEKRDSGKKSDVKRSSVSRIWG